MFSYIPKNIDVLMRKEAQGLWSKTWNLQIMMELKIKLLNPPANGNLVLHTRKRYPAHFKSCNDLLNIKQIIQKKENLQ